MTKWPIPAILPSYENPQNNHQTHHQSALADIGRGRPAESDGLVLCIGPRICRILAHGHRALSQGCGTETNGNRRITSDKFILRRLSRTSRPCGILGTLLAQASRGYFRSNTHGLYRLSTSHKTIAAGRACYEYFFARVRTSTCLHANP